MSPEQAKQSYKENMPFMGLTLWKAGVSLELSYRLARAAALDFLVRVDDINDRTVHTYGFIVEGVNDDKGISKKIFFNINTKLSC